MSSAKPNVKDELDHRDPGGQYRGHMETPACSGQTGESKDESRQDGPKVMTSSQDTSHPNRPNRKRNLLDQVLSEKKMALLRSPEVIQWLQSQQSSRRENKQCKKRRSDPAPGSDAAVSSDQHRHAGLDSHSYTPPQPMSTHNPNLSSQATVTYKDMFSPDSQGHTWESGQSSPGNNIFTDQGRGYDEFRSGHVGLESPDEGMLQIDLSKQDSFTVQFPEQLGLHQSGQKGALLDDMQQSLRYPDDISHSGQGQNKVIEYPGAIGNSVQGQKKVMGYPGDISHLGQGHNKVIGYPGAIGNSVQGQNKTMRYPGDISHSGQGQNKVILPNMVEGHANMTGHIKDVPHFQLPYQLKGQDGFSQSMTSSQGCLLPKPGHPADRFIDTTFSTAQRSRNVTSTTSVYDPIAHAQIDSFFTITNRPGDMAPNLHQLACIATDTMAPQGVQLGASSYSKTETVAPPTNRDYITDTPSTAPS